MGRKVFNMKRMFFGGMLYIAGFIGILSLGIVSVYNPVIFNGISGFRGFLLDSDTTFLFIISCVLCVIGFIICLIDAYFKK